MLFRSRFLIFGDADRQEFRLWWENLPENVRERGIFAENRLPADLCTSSVSEYSADVHDPAVSADVHDPTVSADVHDPAVSADVHDPAVSTNVHETPDPDFLVLLRSWSGEFSDSWVLELQKKFPLAPILAVLGSWCEGEARTGTPLAGVHSMLWYDFAAMAPLECFAFEKGWASIWSLPVTVLPEERAIFELKREEKWKLFRNVSSTVPNANTKNSPALRPLRFLIESEDFDQFVFLRDLCLRSDWKGRTAEVFGSWLGKEDGIPGNTDSEAEAVADFLLFDFPDFSEAAVAHFHALKARNPEAVPIAFTEFPRPDEWHFLWKENVQIFPKPFRIADFLFFCLNRLS